MSKYIKVTEKEFKAIASLVYSDEGGLDSYDEDYTKEVVKAYKAVMAIIKRNQDKD